MHRWETIQKCVNKFCGCLSRIELRRQSGTTVIDKVAEAMTLYKSEDEHEKAFQFMHCWNKLRTQPKWLAKLDELVAAKTSNKKQKTSTPDPSATFPSEIGQHEVEGLENNALTRPIGKKKAKAALLQEKKKSVTASDDDESNARFMRKLRRLIMIPFYQSLIEVGDRMDCFYRQERQPNYDDMACFKILGIVIRVLLWVDMFLGKENFLVTPNTLF